MNKDHTSKIFACGCCRVHADILIQFGPNQVAQRPQSAPLQSRSNGCLIIMKLGAVVCFAAAFISSAQAREFPRMSRSNARVVAADTAPGPATAPPPHKFNGGAGKGQGMAHAYTHRHDFCLTIVCFLLRFLLLHARPFLHSGAIRQGFVCQFCAHHANSSHGWGRLLGMYFF